jgi:hypothetical protein
MAFRTTLKAGDVVYVGGAKIHRPENSFSIAVEADHSIVIIHATEHKPGGYQNDNTKNVKE